MTSVWRLGFALDPPGKLKALPRPMVGEEVVAAPSPRTRTPLMAHLASDLWINPCCIIKMAFLVAIASSCNKAVNQNINSASEMTYIVSGAALNSTHSLNQIIKSNMCVETLQDDNLLIKASHRSDWQPRQLCVSTCTGCGKKVYHYDFCSFLSSRFEFKSEILQMYLVILYAPVLSWVYFHRRSPSQPNAPTTLVCT